MRLLCISDLHADRRAMTRILAEAPVADAVVLAGDLTNFGTPDEAQWFVRQAQAVADNVLAVAGNCDSPEIDRCLDWLGVALFRRGVVHQGVGFYGVSAMPPWHGNMYELTEDELAAALDTGRQQLPTDVEHVVVVSHPPPRDTVVDRTATGNHVGSTAVRALVEEHQPDLVVCGHIHEARGVDRLNRTTIVNCGPGFHGYYAMVEMGITVRVDLRQANHHGP